MANSELGSSHKSMWLFSASFMWPWGLNALAPNARRPFASSFLISFAQDPLPELEFFDPDEAIVSSWWPCQASSKSLPQRGSPPTRRLKAAPAPPGWLRWRRGPRGALPWRCLSGGRSERLGLGAVPQVKEKETLLSKAAKKAMNRRR